jgi:hypothetical protein
MNRQKKIVDPCRTRSMTPAAPGQFRQLRLTLSTASFFRGLKFLAQIECGWEEYNINQMVHPVARRTTIGCNYRSNILGRFSGYRFWILAEHIHRNHPRAVIVVISLGRLEVQPGPRFNSEETSQADRINRSVIILASMKLHRVSVRKNEAMDPGGLGRYFRKN